MQVRPVPWAASAVCATFACGAAFADAPRWELPPGGRARGGLDDGGSHLFAVRLVEGTVYSARVTGRRGFTPRLDVLDEAQRPLDVDAADLARWSVPETRVHLLRVSGDGPGTYVLSTSGRPPRGVERALDLAPGGSAVVTFHAAAGATASVTVRRAPSSLAEPLLVGARDARGNEATFDRVRDRRASTSAALRCGTSGEYAVEVGAAPGTSGRVLVTVRVRTPRAPPLRHRLSPATRIPDFAWFAAEVQPVFQNRGCNASSCHGAVAGQGRMILRGPAQGPFPLEETYWNYFQLARWVEVGDAGSRALLKPLSESDGGVFHGGGDVFRRSDPEYDLFRDWVLGAALPSVPPVADAGEDAKARVGSAVRLDGRGARDVVGQYLSYSWTMASRPAGSTAALDDDTAPAPALVPDRSGVYLARLVAVDSAGVESAPDHVAIAVDASTHAGIVGFEAEHAALTGSATVEADDDASGRAYTSVSGPGDEATWLFDVAEDGDFALWPRVRGATVAASPLAWSFDDETPIEWQPAGGARWTFQRCTQVRLAAGAHRLALRAGAGAASVDSVVLAPADRAPSDRAPAMSPEDLRLLRRIAFDAVNRSPTADELVLAPFLGPEGFARELVPSYAFADAWYEATLVRLGLTGLFAPKPNDADHASLASVPARLANAEIDERRALGEIAKSAAWARRNDDSRDFAFALFEEFLGRPPADVAPSGVKSELAAAREMYDGIPRSLFGETGGGAGDLVDIVLGLAARRPDYAANRVGATAPDPDELARAQVSLLWRRLVPSGPAIAAGTHAAWTRRLVDEPGAMPEIVREILASPEYRAAAATPRPKSVRQLIRGLHVDVLARGPDAASVAAIEEAIVAFGDPAPVVDQVVRHVVRAAEAAHAAPPLQGLEIDTWIDGAFARMLGREPTTAERDAFRTFLESSPHASTSLALEALLTSREYLGY